LPSWGCPPRWRQQAGARPAFSARGALISREGRGLTIDVSRSAVRRRSVPRWHSSFPHAGASPRPARQRASNGDRELFSLHQGLQQRGLGAAAVLDTIRHLDGEPDGIKDNNPEGARLLSQAGDVEQLASTARADVGRAVLCVPRICPGPPEGLGARAETRLMLEAEGPSRARKPARTLPKGCRPARGVEQVALPQRLRLRAARSGDRGHRLLRPPRHSRARALAQVEAPGSPWRSSGGNASGGNAGSSRRGASASAVRRGR
jgi:hypothetical protein